MRSEKRNRKSGQTKHSFVHTLTDRLQEALDVPLECVSSVSTIEIKGDGEVVVSGCAGVFSYTEDTVRLHGRKGTVTIYGTSLEMQSLIGDRVTVHGKIRSVCLNEEDGGGEKR